jgi:hypothetical protein
VGRCFENYDYDNEDHYYDKAVYYGHDDHNDKDAYDGDHDDDDDNEIMHMMMMMVINSLMICENSNFN